MSNMACYFGSCSASPMDVFGARRLHVVQTPDVLAAAYREMLGVVPLASAPRLAVVASAHGAGGMFSPGLIVVGKKDVLALVDQLVVDYDYELRRTVKPTVWLRPHIVVRALRRMVSTRVVAHELGHALVHAGFRTPYPHEEEAAADYLAGRMDAACGRRTDLARLLFHAIGCSGARCTHPEPDQRVAAYECGYGDQVNALDCGYSAGGLDVEFVA